MGVRFDSAQANAIMAQEPGAALRLVYQIKMAVHKKSQRQDRQRKIPQCAQMGLGHWGLTLLPPWTGAKQEQSLRLATSPMPHEKLGSTTVEFGRSRGRQMLDKMDMKALQSRFATQGTESLRTVV